MADPEKNENIENRDISELNSTINESLNFSDSGKASKEIFGELAETDSETTVTIPPNNLDDTTEDIALINPHEVAGIPVSMDREMWKSTDETEEKLWNAKDETSMIVNISTADENIDCSTKILGSENFGGNIDSSNPIYTAQDTKATLTNASNINEKSGGSRKGTHSEDEETFSGSKFVLNAIANASEHESEPKEPSHSLHKDSSYLREDTIDKNKENSECVDTSAVTIAEEAGSAAAKSSDNKEDDKESKILPNITHSIDKKDYYELNMQDDKDINKRDMASAEVEKHESHQGDLQMNNDEDQKRESRTSRNSEEKWGNTVISKESLLVQHPSVDPLFQQKSGLLRSSAKIQQTKTAPRMLTKSIGMQSANAYNRIRTLNNDNDIEDILPELPGPGSYGLTDQRRSLLSLMSCFGCEFPRRVIMHCACLSILSLILIILEISYIISAPNLAKNKNYSEYNNCTATPAYIYCVSNSVIWIVIFEWVIAWLFIEASPMLLSKKFRSSVLDTNIGLEMMYSTLPPPAKSEPASKLFILNDAETNICLNPPEIKCIDPQISATDKTNFIGAGLRGSFATDMKYDRLRFILSCMVFLLYCVCIAMLFFGIYCLLFEHCKSLLANFIMIHCLLLLLRLLNLSRSSLCRGVCKAIRGSRAPQRIETPPIITNTMDTEFTDLKNYPLYNR